MRALLIAATLLLLAPRRAPPRTVVIDGRGWGHGVGLSQYGAYGYALREGRDYQFILAHYYTGSELGTRAGHAHARAAQARRRAEDQRRHARASPAAGGCGCATTAATASRRWTPTA